MPRVALFEGVVFGGIFVRRGLCTEGTYVSQVLRRGTVLGKISSKRMNFRYVKEVFS